MFVVRNELRWNQLLSDVQLSPRSYLHPIATAGQRSHCLYATRHTLPFAVYSQTLAFRSQYKLSLNNNICLGAIFKCNFAFDDFQWYNYFKLLNWIEPSIICVHNEVVLYIQQVLIGFI